MNMPDTTIVECNYSIPDHLTAVGELMNEYINDKMGGGKPLSKLETLRLVEALNEHPKSIVLLAKTGDDYSGLMVAFENFSTFSVKPMINIHDLIVRKEHRGKGIGRLLLETITEIGIKRQCSRITLEVREDNITAQYLYKTLGFAETEPVMLYWRKNLTT